MNVLIADDEPLARARLAAMVSRIEGCQLLEPQASNGKEALQLCAQHNPDVLLLDIQMPELDGIEVATALNRLPNTPAIIFCTAHDEFALPAFAVHALGYLVKPVRAEQLEQIMQRARLLTQAGAGEQAPAPRTHISAKTHKGLECIALDDILYFQAEHKYVTVYHRRGETLIDEPLKALEQEFADQLVRIHRSILVNRSVIERMERAPNNGQQWLHLSAWPEPLPVSRRHAGAVRKLMHRL
ncbi:MAG: response regulator transcription factor [Thiopseudomonas sp.]|nr:response regulator transcription factor [Thiopseudomonas sp.]